MANYGLREREERERETELIYKRVVKKMRGRERERERVLAIIVWFFLPQDGPML